MFAGLLLLLAAGLIVGWVLLVLFTCWLLTHPPRRTYAHALSRNLPGDPSELTTIAADGSMARGLPFTQWMFRSRGVDLPVWDITGLDPAGPTIILTHGWGDSRVVMLGRIAALAPMAARLVAWDIPAHGDAPRGRFSLGAREHLDLMELYDKVARAAPSGSPNRVVLYGFSLGAGASIHAAAKLSRAAVPGTPPPAGVIAESPYRVPITPARNVLRMRAMPFRTNIAPAMILLRLRFGRMFGAKAFDRAQMRPTTPMLLLHGTLDPICPLQDSHDIAAGAPNARMQDIPGGGHGTLWTDPGTTPMVADAVRAFLYDLASSRTPNSHTPAMTLG